VAVHPLQSQCGAPTRRGGPCRRKAGWGTGHPGTGLCRRHDADAPRDTPADPEPPPPDPVERMRVLANLMTQRALAAHDAATQDPQRDTDAIDARIARAVRTAAQATRVELAAQKAKVDAAGADEVADAIMVTVRRIGDGTAD